LSNAQAEFSRRLGEVTAENARALGARDEEARAALESTRAELARLRDGTSAGGGVADGAAHAAEIEVARKRSEADLAQAAAAAEAAAADAARRADEAKGRALGDLRSQYDAKLAEAKRSGAAEVERAEAVTKEKVAALEKKNQELADSNAEGERLKGRVREREEELATLRSEAKRVAEAAAARLASAQESMAAADADAKRREESLRVAHERELRGLGEEQLRETRALQAEFEAAMGAMRVEMERVRAELEAMTERWGVGGGGL
jgi:chromosome segregation ATPase